MNKCEICGKECEYDVCEECIQKDLEKGGFDNSGYCHVPTD